MLLLVDTIKSKMSRNNTPTRRYGEIISNIFGGGKGSTTTSSSHPPPSDARSRSLLDETVSEEAKRRFRERRQQSQSPIRNRTHQTTVNMASGNISVPRSRSTTPEHRQAPPTMPPPAPPNHRTATPPRRSLLRRRNSAKHNQQVPSTGLPSTMSASAVRARSISPGWRRGITSGSHNNSNQRNMDVVGDSSASLTKNKVVTFPSNIVTHEQQETEERQRHIQEKNALEETVAEQQKQLRFYEARLKDGVQELGHLNRELTESRKKQARLELELEVHDFKFSIYDDYRRLLDIQRLNDRADDDGNDSSDDGRDDDIQSDAQVPNSSCKIQSERDIAIVFAKLERLENMLKQNEQESASRYAALYEDYKKALTKIFFLERHKSSSAGDVKLEKRSNEEDFSEEKNSMSSTIVSVPVSELLSMDQHEVDDTTSQHEPESSITKMLKKRITLLEAEKIRHSKYLQSLQEEVERLRAMQNDTTAFQSDQEVNKLRLERDALVNRIAALETEIGFTSGQIGDKTRTRRYRALEKNLNGYTVEIMSLEDKVRAKESVIAKLKERDLSRRLGSLDSADTMISLAPTSPTKLQQSKKNAFLAATVTPEGNKKISDEVSHSDVDFQSRLNEKIEELKTKSKQLGAASSKATDGSSTHITATSVSGSERVAMLRKRLEMLSNINGQAKDEVSVFTDGTDSVY